MPGAFSNRSNNILHVSLPIPLACVGWACIPAPLTDYTQYSSAGSSGKANAVYRILACHILDIYEIATSIRCNMILYN